MNNLAQDILATLNTEQQSAVSAPLCHQLIIAGAGSGKTRVIVHRMAWLMCVEQIPARQILAVTFTNKAAKEIAHRTQTLSAQGQPLVGTFHGICHRWLRSYSHHLNINERFQIIDSDDQLRLIKRIMQDRQLDDQRANGKKVQYWINQQKEAGKRADDCNCEEDPLWHSIYQEYEQRTQQAQLYDFTELLLKTVEALRHIPSFRQALHQQYQHLLIDEFQDTNPLQYELIRLLSHEQSWVCAVGDDDQSIYSWRGARVDNIRYFERDYRCETYRLTQNYRSSAYILQAANQVIAHNNNRLGKDLWTEAGSGEKIQIFTAFNEHDEARFVAENIQQHRLQSQALLSDYAILYRSNAQSRVFEEKLNQLGLPYRIYGGLRFFDRAEIKDIIAYLRLALHSDDDSAFERIVNTPARGIGHATLDKVRQHAKSASCSLWASIIEMEPAIQNKFHTFQQLIGDIQDKITQQPLPQTITDIVNLIGYQQYLQRQHSEQAKNKMENIDELINATEEYTRQHMSSDHSHQDIASYFLSHIALDSGDSNESGDQAVQLMTLHAAKGMEFPNVFLVGLEEGLFPHKMCLHDDSAIEEERRLCYVGITRARQRLVMSWAECRRLYQQESYQRQSRFISELPTECYDYIRASKATHQIVRPSASQYPFKLGDTVIHAKFGDGVILALEGDGEQARVHVHFHQVGSKWLMLSYAKLQKA